MIATATDPAKKLRIPPPLLKRVEASAARQGRSLNSEILIRLSDSFKSKKK